MAEKIILDVDTGSDDAVAIMTAVLSPDIDLTAVCTVAGNKSIENTTENTLRVLDAMHSNIPVYRGCASPIIKGLVNNRLPPSHRKEIMIDGKVIQMHDDLLDLPVASRKHEETPAAVYYVETLRKAKQPITLVAVGPLTNLAVAFLIDPLIVKNIKKIVIMGGGYKVTNSSPSAEFNVFYDPEAAEIVQKSGAKILWVPLDATHAAYLTKEDCKRFRSLNTFAGDFAAKLIEQRIVIHNALQPLAVPDAAAVHDALAVCAVIDESVLQDVRHVHCDIGLGDYAEGQTIIDPRYYPEERNCYFAFNADPVKFCNMLYEIFSKK
nr:nucleoside hydrolase [Treponema socranskii]